MRFLKNKIAKAQEHNKKRFLRQEVLIMKKEKKEMPKIFFNKDISNQGSQRHHSRSRYPITPLKTRQTKSVVKNYGKAICSFACSDLAKPHLQPMIKKENVEYGEFVRFMSDAKESLGSIRAFQALLLITNTDERETITFKRICARIGEVFIKYFSVNWIFSGKLVHKEAHLKARFKMLRRIRDPQNFTYLK